MPAMSRQVASEGHSALVLQLTKRTTEIVKKNDGMYCVSAVKERSVPHARYVVKC